MIRQTHAGDTVLVKSREMTGWAQTLPWWLGGEGVKTTENKIHWPLDLTHAGTVKISSDKGYRELRIRIHTIPKLFLNKM